MEILRDAGGLQRFRQSAFVPTMGALHEGHLSLIRLAKETGRTVLLSIFVNPTQFGPEEDFEGYPRDLDRDCRRAEHAGADAVFAPDRDLIYPRGDDEKAPALPDVATKPGLEDRARPGHFAGVCLVVSRLFDLVQPAAACFGEKDYQQLLTIRGLVDRERTSGRWGDLRIMAGPTVRESDGLAASSRNAYLDEVNRQRATAIHQAIQLARERLSPNQQVSHVEQEMRAHLVRYGFSVDYAVVRDSLTLMPIDTPGRTCRALIAARLESGATDVRLIDNDDVSLQG